MNINLILNTNVDDHNNYNTHNILTNVDNKNNKRRNQGIKTKISARGTIWEDKMNFDSCIFSYHARDFFRPFLL